MKHIQDNINEWLRQEAHVVPGHAFQKDDCSCLPVWPEDKLDLAAEKPHGFLVSLGYEVTYLDAHTPEGEQLVDSWLKSRLSEILHDACSLPAECWYG